MGAIQLPDYLVSEDALVKSICEEEFYSFVREFWDTVVPDPPVWNWHIKYLCDELQKVAERVFKGVPKKYDLVINIPPGSTKSTIASVMFPMWAWARMPRARCICGSYTAPLALDLGRRSRLIARDARYQRIWGLDLLEDQNAKRDFGNQKGGQRMAVGTGNQITGNHGHFLIVDDPLDPEGADSEADIKTANKWMDETLSTRKVSKLVTPLILIMQRLHQNDPTGHILARAKEGKRVVKHICLDGILDETSIIRPNKLRDRYVNGLLDPVRLSRAALKNLEGELGQFGYACQIRQNPIPRGGGMFKSGKIRKDTPNPKHPFKAAVRYWDKAATEGGGKRTAGVCMAEDSAGRFWILNVKKGQWSSDQREDIIHQTAQSDHKLYGKKYIIGLEQEPGSGGKESAEASVKRLAGFRIKVDRPTGDKVFRADPFSVQVNHGNVSMVPGPWNADFLDELQYFPNSTFKDQVDGASGAFNLLTKRRKRAGGIK